MSGRTKETPETKSRLRRLIDESPFFCKIIELIFCVIAIGLIVDPFNESSQGIQSSLHKTMNHAAIVYVATCGYIVINTIVIICYLFGERQPKKMSMIFAVVGAVLCCAAGSVLIDDRKKLQGYQSTHYFKRYSSQIVASGVFDFLAALVFVIDAVLTNKFN